MRAGDRRPWVRLVPLAPLPRRLRRRLASSTLLSREPASRYAVRPPHACPGFDAPPEPSGGPITDWTGTAFGQPGGPAHHASLGSTTRAGTCDPARPHACGLFPARLPGGRPRGSASSRGRRPGRLADDLRDRLHGPSTPMSRSAWSRRLGRRAALEPMDPRHACAWERLAHSHGRVTIAELADDAGGRGATSRSGSLPSSAGAQGRGRPLRFGRSREMVPRHPAVEVAQRCANADQSHLVREMATTPGTTPGVGRARRHRIRSRPDRRAGAS